MATSNTADTAAPNAMNGAMVRPLARRGFERQHLRERHEHR